MTFEVVHSALVKDRTSDALSRLLMIGMDESPQKEDVPVLATTELQPEGEETEPDSKIWHSLLGNNESDTVKPAGPEGLQVSDGNEKERPFTTREFVTEQANNLDCR